MISISVITCTYNAESVLKRTLDSVASQSHKAIEHIIVDGCSKDKTAEMAKKYAAESPEGHKVRINIEPDKGLYDAMNKGIVLATGDYIVFLNAGDTFTSPAMLEEMAAKIDEGSTLPGVLYGNTDIVDETGKYLGKRHLQPPEKLNWKSFRNGMLVCHQAFYCRTDIAKKTLYDLQYRLSADVDWCIRVMKRCNEQNLALFNTRMVLCRYLGGGMSIQNHRASLLERFNIMRKHYGLITTVMMHVWFIFRKK